MSSTEPPPTYSQNASEQEPEQPQILIVPPADGVGFQKGYLGADGERAAVEGELQIKGVHGQPWGRVYVFIRASVWSLLRIHITLLQNCAIPHS